MRRPCVKDIAVNVGIDEADGQQGCSQEGSDSVRAAFGVPVVRSKTPLPFGRIAMCTGHIVTEPALVNIDNGAVILLKRLNLLLEGLPLVCVCLWVTKRFFYMSRQADPRHDAENFAQHQTVWHVHIDRHQESPQHLF